jgi:3-phosphoshikimate 1-carboxyvinyltransferase
LRVQIHPQIFSGKVRIPASKSHTIRQLLIASLADGVSNIQYPLDSLDTRSCVSVCRAFGAQITGNLEEGWEVRGNNRFLNFKEGDAAQVDVGNSGTTLFMSLAVAALQPQTIEFTGDDQIKKRGAVPLLEALAAMGVSVRSNNGCAPIAISGPWKGGKTTLVCPTSQYLSAMLIASPLAPSGAVTEIDVPLLNEKPYIDMTLSYLQEHNLQYLAEINKNGTAWSGHFLIHGGQSWKPFSRSVPGDFSSAAFPAAAAVISGGTVHIMGLDSGDTQGDKYFFEILKQMGCDIEWSGDATVTVTRKASLRGGTFDLNAAPDLLPAAAVTAAFAQGDTALVNAAHARIKETDRISAMAAELAKIGVSCTERPDGLVIHGKGPIVEGGALIDGRGDHRIVMAFAAAALGCRKPLEIDSAESAAVTYPGFLELLPSCKFL